MIAKYPAMPQKTANAAVENSQTNSNFQRFFLLPAGLGRDDRYGFFRLLF
jgi:hypothetical protein